MEEDKTYFDDNKELIDPQIHTCLYFLIKYLFLGEQSMRESSIKKLKDFIKRINLDIKLNKNATNIENMNKIFNYIKTQNSLLASEILENIIIKVLSFALNVEKDEFFGKYLYNDMGGLKNNKDTIINWIVINNIKPLLMDKGNNYLESIFVNDQVESDINEEKRNNMNEFNNECTFLQLLYSINDSRIKLNKSINSEKLVNDLNKTEVSYTNTYSRRSVLLSPVMGKTERDKPLTPSMSIFISTYIYHQNKNSTLMDFAKASENLVRLPYTYELSEAGINDIYLDIILKPVRIEPRIEDIELNKNKVQDKGILELHKSMIFNKRIKTISINSSSIKSINLDTFSLNYKLFKNKSIEELSMSSNYLKSDADTNLSKLISYLTELKTLNLSFNILNSGVASLFATLKNLYRQKNSKLETLILINCYLDDISFYELGELLKSKYCQLKCLCLNENRIPSDVNFFNALKKNRSLEEIYFYGCKINSDKTDEIERIISNSNLESLYLYSNQIHDFNQYIRILYRNSLVKNQKEEKNKNLIYLKPCLYNLNMNNFDCYNQNMEKLKLMLNGIEKTSLSCLDITSVLKDPSLDANNVNYKYYKGINDIKSYLEKNKMNI